MLETLIVVLLILWLVGLGWGRGRRGRRVGRWAGGNLIHILLVIVLILLLGEYLIPTLLGGGKVFFIGNALVDLFLQSRNWPFGSAIAVSLVVIAVLVLILTNRLAMRLSGA